MQTQETPTQQRLTHQPTHQSSRYAACLSLPHLNVCIIYTMVVKHGVMRVPCQCDVCKSAPPCCCCRVSVQSFGSLYNIPQPWTPGYAAVDVLHASRTLVWLKGEEVLITYDRATTAHSGKFKRWNMNFIAAPAVTGPVVRAVGRVNQVSVTSLLPVNGNITVQVRGRVRESVCKRGGTQVETSE